MLPHDEQGLAMADLGAQQATRPEVGKLAAQLRDAQRPEITRLTGYRDAWGAGAPTPASEHGDTPMYDPLAELRNASGERFDTMFLQLMVVHHQSGLAAARTEAAEGRNPELTRLAAAIVANQPGEINRMQALVTG